MKIACVLPDVANAQSADLTVVLYDHATKARQGSIGAAIKDRIAHAKLAPSSRAWDLLTIALAVTASDLAGHRNRSSDGWTREFDLTVSVVDPAFWKSQTGHLERLLGYLTTDLWSLTFIGGGFLPKPPKALTVLDEQSIVLLSGGLDSTIGAIDLAKTGKKLIAVSQIVRGDAEKQVLFAGAVGGGLRHYQFNHNASIPDGENPPSQRARSLVFFAYGVLVATCLGQHQKGVSVPLNVCENAFIAINPPLTPGRLGSLSTRTSHPVVLDLLQDVLDAADLRVDLINPYRFTTKGEMLALCKDQLLLKQLAHQTTSCGRFKQYGYRHCGRCVPCLIRRAAFHKWGASDQTKYKFEKLSVNSLERARFDDVRSACMAVHDVAQNGLDRWLGASLTGIKAVDVPKARSAVHRGLTELGVFLDAAGVK